MTVDATPGTMPRTDRLTTTALGSKAMTNLATERDIATVPKVG